MNSTDYMFEQMEKGVCRHPNLIPFVLVFVRKIYPNGYREPPEYDYSATNLNASELHVKKFLCLDCNAVIKAPNIYNLNDED